MFEGEDENLGDDEDLLSLEAAAASLEALGSEEVL